MWDLIVSVPDHCLSFYLTVRNTTEVPPWNGQYKNAGRLKSVLWVPNLALGFCYMTRIMINRNGNVKHKTKHLVIRKAG